MKYIRIKCGKIIDVERRYKLYVKNDKIKHKVTSFSKFLHVGHYAIVKEADSIEELCDEFVLESKDKSYRTLLVKAFNYTDKISLFNSFMKDAKSGWLSYCNDCLQQGCTIYGAIWTDSCLKYVAKMNKEGEFKLI